MPLRHTKEERPWYRWGLALLILGVVMGAVRLGAILHRGSYDRGDVILMVNSVVIAITGTAMMFSRRPKL
jgi:hypothetical protein